MMSVKDAIKAAKVYVEDLYEDADLKDVLLDEVRLERGQ